MIPITSILQQSLTDPPATGAIATAATWVSDLLFGPLASGIAIIAVAWIGFAMLSGRLEIRRGLSVLLGCFLLFGAKDIAEGLRLSTSDTPPIAAAPPPPVFAKPARPAPSGDVYDPYAGASVMRSTP